MWPCPCGALALPGMAVPVRPAQPGGDADAVGYGYSRTTVLWGASCAAWASWFVHRQFGRVDVVCRVIVVDPILRFFKSYFVPFFLQKKIYISTFFFKEKKSGRSRPGIKKTKIRY